MLNSKHHIQLGPVDSMPFPAVYVANKVRFIDYSFSLKVIKNIIFISMCFCGAQQNAGPSSGLMA